VFESRLKILLAILAIPLLAVVLRLVQLQVVQADTFFEKAERMLDRPPRFYPALRGEITDRRGRLLAYDAPVWDIAVHYAVMVDEPSLRHRVLRRLDVEWSDDLDQRIEESWRVISDLTGIPLEELRERQDRIVRTVDRIKRWVSDRRGVETEIAEEFMPHAVARGLEQRARVAAGIALADYPWVEVVPSHTRRYEGGKAVGHILGRLGEVDRETIESDPMLHDPLARYQPGDLHGIRGAEALGESWLRGRRGRVHENLEGEPLSPPVEPVDGKAMTLTIDLPLQQAIYHRLQAVIESQYPFSTGGSAVVLDVPTREVLALVSYPSIEPDPNDRAAGNDPTQDDLRQPYLFRAIGKNYPPGSIVKPLLLTVGMKQNKVHSGTTIHCGGLLFADHPDRWRCLGTHGHVDPITSIQRSCNIFYYKLGEWLGTQSIAYWMREFGLGHETGTNLPEETHGHLPRSINRGTARLAAIGQGELDITPIQAANLTATIATGMHQPVTLWADDPNPKPQRNLGISAHVWRTVREGMYRVVNVDHGTAFQRAVLDNAGEFVLLGKTGSAEAPPREWLYQCRFPNGRLESIKARNANVLLRRFDEDQKPEIIKRFRIDQEDPTHGWFIGYLAPREHYLASISGDRPSVAIAVVIEYSGHGGEVAAPVAAEMLQSVLLQRDGRLETRDDPTSAELLP
jgi:penicillin-binding protein 2